MHVPACQAPAHGDNDRGLATLRLEDLQDLGILGSGSSGVARKVRHLPTGRLLCLKVAPAGPRLTLRSGCKPAVNERRESMELDNTASRGVAEMRESVHNRTVRYQLPSPAEADLLNAVSTNVLDQTMNISCVQVIPFDVQSEQLRKQISAELHTLHGSRHPHIVAYYTSFLQVRSWSPLMSLRKQLNMGILVTLALTILTRPLAWALMLACERWNSGIACHFPTGLPQTRP